MREGKGLRRLVIPDDGYPGLHGWKFHKDDRTYESTYYDHERDMQCSIDIGSFTEAEEEFGQLIAEREREEAEEETLP